MIKEHKFIFNDTVVAVEEEYRGDLGCVMFGKKLKDGNINVFLETYSPSIVEFFVELQKYITDLEAKLVDSKKSNEYFADRVEKADKEIKEIYKKYNKLVEEYNNLKEEVDNNFVDGQKYNELKQQLAERNDRISRLQFEVQQALSNSLGKTIKELIEFDNQAKIDFAVAELEKVKDKVICGVMDISNPFWSCFRKDGGQYMTSEDLHNALEQEFTYQIQEQIKELKEKK